MPFGPCFAASALVFVLGQGAEPAPDASAASFLGLRAGASVRTGAVGSEEPPRLGVAFALVMGRRFATVASGRLGLGAQVELGYTRHAKTVKLDTVDGEGMPIKLDAARMVGIGDFTALAVADRVHGRVRPWAGVGGGLRVGYYAREQLFDPAGQPEGNEGKPARPVAQLAAGADVALDPQLALGARVDFLHTVGASTPAFPGRAGGRAPALRDGVLVSFMMTSRF